MCLHSSVLRVRLLEPRAPGYRILRVFVADGCAWQLPSTALAAAGGRGVAALVRCAQLVGARMEL